MSVNVMKKIAIFCFVFFPYHVFAESLNIGPYWFSIGESEKSALSKIKEPYSYVQYGNGRDYIVRHQRGGYFNFIGQLHFEFGDLEGAAVEWFSGEDREAVDAVETLFDALSNASKKSGLKPTVEIENVVSPTVNFDKIVFEFGERSVELNMFEMKDGSGSKQINVTESISRK